MSAQPTVLVEYGSEPSSEPDDFILVTSVATYSDFANATGTSLNERLDLGLTISCARGGSNSQQTASERAWALLDLVEAKVRADIKLGGVVLWCRRTKAQEDETRPDSANDGRYSTIFAVFSAESRI